jgi:flagella basal body P-ring formation protein FlgA
VAPQAPVAGASAPPVAGWILVLARDVARGGKISEADVEWAAPPAGARAHGPSDLDAIVGQEARRLLKAGQPLQTSDLKPATVIHKGDPVQLVYAAEGLRLTVDGQAQSDAAAGDAVRVLNRYSKRSIDAVATAEGEARVSR